MTLRKLLCNSKDRVATEDNNIVYEIDCSNCQAVYFGESKRSLKSRSDEHKRSVRNCDKEKKKLKKKIKGPMMGEVSLETQPN